MNNSFIDLGISQPILKAIEEMGFEAPTEVQERAIPHILNKEDVIVKSKTGSGKTAVFGIPILQLTDPSAAGPQALILTPTRELAVQLDEDIKQFSKYLQHKTAVVYGQHSMNTEIHAIRAGACIVTGTPGRVFDHISHGSFITKNIRFLVLDEADRMLDMGFLEQVVRIIRTIPKDRVTLLFSATIPDDIQKICQNYMKSPEMIEIESPTMTVDTIEQKYYRVANNEKNTQLHRLLLYEQPESCMIFCNTKIAVDRVQSFLQRKGYSSQALHGDIPQGKRMKTIEEFKLGEFHLLVATDVAARGIHIDDLSLVINYDVPNEKDNYVHRIGRTGRAGHTGRSITLSTGNDIMSLYEIEEHIGTMIAEAEMPTDAELNERKDGAEKWKKVNALKVRPAHAAAAGNTHSERTVRGEAKPVRKNRPPRADAERDGQQNRPPRAAAERNTQQSRPPRADAERDGQQNRPPRATAEHNAQQSRPPRAAAERDAQHGRPPRTAAERNAQQSRPPRAAAERNVQQSRPPRAAAERNVQQSRPPRAAAERNAQQSRPPQPAKAGAVNAPQNVPVDQSQGAAEKKSFLQRVLHRILGK